MKLVPFIVLGIFVLVFILSKECGCKSDVSSSMVDEVKKKCFESYEEKQCAQIDTDDPYALRKKCEYWKKCLENPEAHVKK